jgi:PAS domain S-box-containing protein
MKKAHGKEKSNLLGLNITDIYSKKIGQHRLNKVKEVVKTQKSIEFIDIIDKRFYKTTYYPIFGKNGDVEKIIDFIQDITEEKLKEKQILKNKEDYFESLIENSLDLITVVDRQGKILYDSVSLKNILKYSPEKRINQSVFDFVHPQDKQRVKEFFSKVISKPGLTEKISFRIKDKMGNWHYFESLGNNQLDNRKIKGLIINSRDISQNVKQKMEKDAILDNTSEVIAFHDNDHRILWANKAYQKETGVELDQLIGKKCFHAWGEDKSCIKCPLSKALKTGKTSEAIISTKNQNMLAIENKTWRVIGDPVFDGDNNISGVIELSYDITLQKQAEEEIRRTKDHLEKLINNTSEIIFSIDNDFRITVWNKTAENLSGIKSYKVIGKDIRNQQFIDNAEELQKFLELQLAHEPALLKQVRLKTLFGSIRNLKVSTSFVTDENNKITDIIFICQDVTSKEQTHGRLTPGLSYLIDDSSPNQIVALFNDLITENNKGLFITRSQYEHVIQQLKLEYVTFAVLSDRIFKFAPTIQDLDKLKSYIHSFLEKHRNGIICIDRSDYLFTTFGFKQTISSFYDINDSVRKNQAILLLRVNTKIFSDIEYEILKEEFSLLPASQINEVYIDEDLFSILSFINEQNQNNKLVYQKSITQFFKIAKVTGQKRLSELQKKELIFNKRQGNIKQFFITEKGKYLLKNKSKL